MGSKIHDLHLWAGCHQPASDLQSKFHPAKTMKPMLHLYRPAVLTACLIFALAPDRALGSEDAKAAGVSSPPTGLISGRVANAASGYYLEKVRLTVEGTELEAFTDADGFYRLTDVPAGTARIRAFYTGHTPQTEVITIAAGQTVRRDFNFSTVQGRPGGGAEGDIVALSEFVVAVSREMSAAALAINEQRFAPNIKNVLSTDEFGGVSEGNVVEFIKFLPGVTVDYNGGNARTVYINGVPSANVPVTIDGFNLASTESGGTARDVALDFVSINNASFIEVSFSPTPESQGSALAGSVNLVPRSSFGRSHPEYQGSVYLMMRDNDRNYNRTPGPLKGGSRKVHPGFDFSAIVPVNKRFGFTLSGGSSTQYCAQPMASAQWRGASVVTNGGTFPDTTPDQPYLSQYLVRDGSKTTTRNSFGVTLDYKFAANDRLTFSYQVSTFAMLGMNRTLTWNINRVLPGQFTPTSVHGFAGAGNMEIATDSGADRLNRTHMPTLVWRHDGPIWKADAGLGYSQATNAIRGGAKGFVNVLVARRTGVTVSFDDITYLRPGVITVTDGTTGAPVDPYTLGNYALVSANNQDRNPLDMQRSAYANLRRDFYWRVPFAIKGGLDVRQSMRDVPGNYNAPYSYVGADGRASTTPVGSDDSAAPFLDAAYSTRTAPFGFPRIQYVSTELVWDAIKAKPAQFVLNENNTYNTLVSTSKRAEELISSAYLRGDLSLLARRLKLIGGVRAEQTNVQAEGPLTDLSRNIQRNSQGRPILSANGTPLPITTDALETSKLTFLSRGTHTEKEYLRLFPSINASFNVRENLIARASYYHSVGRPNFNQYASGVTLPNTDNPPSTTNRISVNNAGIKAWGAQSANVRLEYYFAGVGQLSAGAFRRDFTDFFGSTVFKVTPEFLSLYGIDPATYGAFDVATNYNLPGVVRTEGLEFSYKQALTFLPPWAGSVQVFANASSLRATGPNLGNFTGIALIPRSYNWGASLIRGKYKIRMNWNYRGRQREGLVAAGRSIEPGTYNWTAMRYSYDILGEYNISKRLTAFATLRNVNDAPLQREIAGPSTPQHAYLDQLVEYGALWTFGLKGSF
jgi:TonB-dependent receptor